MSRNWRLLAVLACLGVGGTGWAAPGLATQSQSIAHGSASMQLEEVVVTVDRPEPLRQEERKRMERLRQQLLEEFSRNQLLEKRDNLREQHRRLDRSSSIHWGFDRQRDRNNFHLAGGSVLPWSDISPASFLSLSF